MFKQVLKSGFYNKALITSEVLDIYRSPWIASNDGMKAFSRTIDIPPELMVENRDCLRKINIPTLILWGRKDIFFTFGIARQLHQDIRTSSLVAVDRAGHFLQEEQPEFILKEMIRFFFPETRWIIGITGTIIHAAGVSRFAQALDVSAEELLGIKPSKIEDDKPILRIAQRLKKIENLPPAKQKTLLKTIDTYIKAAQT